MENDKKKEQLFEALLALADLYDKELSKATLGLYWSVLESYTWVQLSDAISNILKTQTFHKFPLPAEIIQRIEDPNQLAIRAMDGWKSLSRAIEFCGIYQSPTFADSIVAHVIDHMDGWIAICAKTRELATERDWTFFRKDFERIYVTIAQRNKLCPIPKMLGLCSRDNIQLPVADTLKKITLDR